MKVGEAVCCNVPSNFKLDRSRECRVLTPSWISRSFMKSSAVAIPKFRLCAVTFEDGQVLGASCFADLMDPHFVNHYTTSRIGNASHPAPAVEIRLASAERARVKT